MGAVAALLASATLLTVALLSRWIHGGEPTLAGLLLVSLLVAAFGATLARFTFRQGPYTSVVLVAANLLVVVTSLFLLRRLI
jgi:hypothetical protein